MNLILYSNEELLDRTEYECETELEKVLWERLSIVLEDSEQKIEELESKVEELENEIEEYKESGSIFMEEIEKLEKRIEELESENV